MNRIEKRFSCLKKNKKKAFIAFITAGYPSLAATEKLVREFDRIGVDVVELGVPFSDPMADGPVIQESSKAALEKKASLKKILGLVKKCRRSAEIPVCLMTYYNPVFCYGEAKFAKDAVAAGVDGVIIPDLPPEEAVGFIKQARQCGLDTVFLAAPTSTAARIKLIANASRGFVYYVSLTGVTGQRKGLARGLARQLRSIRRMSPRPVCVGFGVSTRRQVEEVARIADGVIVGSAIVSKIKENIKRPDMVRRVSNFVSGLKGGQ